jgi:UDP-glucose 4-epimerase
MLVLVTGGAGFIGSHLVDFLIGRGDYVRVIDNLSAGSLNNLKKWKDDQRLQFLKGDLLNPSQVSVAVKGCQVVYHLAANPEVRVRRASPQDHYGQNIKVTYLLLEALRQQGDIENIVFTSSSTVYGEASLIPTPEDYAPMKPISHYGASKLAAEAMICSYASMYGIRSIIYRMANVIGPRSNHGVAYDFVKKLREAPNMLEVLGDGTQSKSYLYIDDFIEGMIIGAEKTEEHVDILNIGSEDKIDVKKIAHIVIQEMGLKGVKIKLTGGIDGGRGWKGDVKLMQLDISKIKSLGWRPKLSSEEAMQKTVNALIHSC